MNYKIADYLVTIYVVFILSLIIIVLAVGVINNPFEGGKYVILLILFLVATIWTIFWLLKLENYMKKKYPKGYEKIERDYRKGWYGFFPLYRVLAGRELYDLKAFIETIIRNPYPEDKIYSRYLNMCRIGILLFLIFTFYLIMLRIL